MPEEIKIKRQVRKIRPKSQLSEEAQLRFLRDILRKTVQTKNHYDQRTNFLFLTSSIIFLGFFGFLLFGNHGTVGSLLVVTTSLLSSVLCLYAYRTPETFRTISDKISVMHHTAIYGMSKREYSKKLSDIMRDPSDMMDAYIFEIYDITQNSIRFKKSFLRWSTGILVMGILLGSVLVFTLP
ncbi:MAG: hypothetical protein HY453_01815 [Parcubacteria group bacterium]|nr:hypothetical protein [Parcubacteria group bacterium]